MVRYYSKNQVTTISALLETPMVTNTVGMELLHQQRYSRIAGTKLLSTALHCYKGNTRVCVLNLPSTTVQLVTVTVTVIFLLIALIILRNRQ
jgi:hypothetical protein